jgi:hypothetical protein
MVAPLGFPFPFVLVLRQLAAQERRAERLQLRDLQVNRLYAILVITLERKTPGEPVDRLRAEAAPLSFVDVRRRLRRWADDHLTELRTIDPAIPSALHDRAADNWRPLLAIAHLAGDAWPTLAAQAAVALSGHDADEVPLAEQVLADLHAIFHDPATAFEDPERDRLSTARVVEWLVALDARPWATYNTKTGKPVTQYQVAACSSGSGCGPPRRESTRSRRTVTTGPTSNRRGRAIASLSRSERRNRPMKPALNR